MKRPLTDTVRCATLLLLAFVVTIGAVGWLLERDTNTLAPVLTAVVAALAASEASNVGKRATTKPELMGEGS